MFLFRKNRGAISVFLVIILVPCMLISSIFVDISRVWLGKSVAESSAELALSTLMTNYDYDLSEIYGLVGSSQDIETYYSLVTEYYDLALHSQDVEDDDVKLLYQRVTNDIGGRFQNETISDLIQVQNKTDGKVVSALPGADMRNPTILEKQIVEFMKYRGPILIVQELIDLLTEEEKRGGVQGSEETAANDAMMDAQEVYYESESDLLKAANKSYWAMRAYTKATAEDTVFTRNTLQTYVDKITGYRSAYEKINELMIKNLYNTEGLNAYTRPNVALDAYTYSKEDESISHLVQPTPAPSSSPSPSDAPAEPQASAEPEYHVTAAKVTELTTGLENAIKTFDEKKKALTDAGNDLMAKQPGNGDNDSYKIQWWVQMNARINSGSTNLSSEVTKAGKSMIDAYAKAKAMIECTADEGVPANWVETAENLIKEAETRQKDYLTTASTKDDPYVNMVRQLERVSQNNISTIQVNNLTVSVNGSSKSIPAALSEIGSELTRIKKQMDEYTQLLNDVIDGNLWKGIPSLQQIKTMINTYQRNLNDWESKAKGAKTPDGRNTELSEEHQKTIDLIRNSKKDSAPEDLTSDMVVKEIKAEELDKLEERFRNARSQFQAMSKAIADMQYGNRKVMDIADYAAFKSAASGQIQADALPLANKALSDYAAARFQALFSPVSGNVVTLHDLSDKDYSPVIHYKDNEENVPHLYRIYWELFGEKGTDAVTEGENEKDKGEKAGEEQEKAILGKARYPGTGQDLPADGNGAFSLGKSLLGSMTKLIKSLVKFDVASIRDDIYVTEYIMNMFSYATFETENQYDLVKEANKADKLSLSGYQQVYDGFKGAADKDGTWLSENPEDAYNKTLTNEMINAANNHAYQAEIEYILYGKSNAESVKAVYNTIYEIRILLNTASALLNFWGPGTTTGNAINIIANSLSAITAFIIPAPLFKLVMIGALVIFETGKDLDRLQAGFPVELYKGKDDWWISLPEFGKDAKMGDFVDALKGSSELEGKKIEDAKGLRYSDYLTLFVYLGLSAGDDTAQGIYRRMANAIEANMRLRTKDNGYSLEKTKVYFRLKSKLRVDPLMLTVPYYSDYLTNPTLKDDWCTFEVDMIRGY